MAGKEGKGKRKRDHDGSTTQPKKKVAIQTAPEQAQSSTIKVASVQVESTCPPVIGQ